jgi:hypothetical protein
MKNFLQIIIVIGIAASILSGCAAPIQMITPAQESLKNYKVLEIAEMKSDIIGKTDAGVLNRIMEEVVVGILDLKHFDTLIVSDTIGLEPKLAAKVLSPASFNDSTAAVALLKSTLVEYEEGSGLLRFLFGAFAGSGKVTLELVVSNKTSHKLLMKARTTANITGMFSSVNDVVDPLKRAIVNFVEDYFVKEKKYKPLTAAERW